MKQKKFLSMFLALAMVLSLAAVPASAAAFPDTKTHWGADSVDRWADYGIFRGNEKGEFEPDKSMTRAEFATMLVNLMGYTVKGSNTFADVPDDAWFTDAILKLSALGILQGDGVNARPNSPISREEAAVLLCRALHIEPSEEAELGFDDARYVASWAKGAVAALEERGMVQGMGDNKYEPKLNISRASVARMVDNMIAVYVVDDEEITGKVNGLVVVAAKDVEVTVKDATLSEPLIVAPKAADAAVELTGKTAAADVIVSASGAAVTVGENAKAETVALAGKGAAADVQGAVDTVSAEAANTSTTVTGKVDTVAVAEGTKGTKVAVAKGAEVGTVVADAPAAVDNQGTVKKLEANKDVTVEGNKPQKTEGDGKVTGGAVESSSSGGSSSGGGSGSGGGSSSAKTSYEVKTTATTGGKVTLNISATKFNTWPEEGVIATFTADPGYILTKATLTRPGQAAVDITEDVKRAAADKAAGTFWIGAGDNLAAGTYTFAGEFVKPLPNAAVFLVNGDNYLSQTKAKMAEYGYEQEEDPNGLARWPWLFFGFKKSTEMPGNTYAVKDLKVFFGGEECGYANVSWLPLSASGIKGRWAAAFIKENETVPDQDHLNITAKKGTITVTFTCEGAEYSFSVDYVAPDAGDIKDATVVFKDGNTTVRTDNTYAGATIKAPAAPQNPGYSFDGWKLDDTQTVAAGGTITVPEADTAKTYTYTAQWTAETYGITYDLAGGALAQGESNPGTYQVTDNAITLKNPAKAGYAFAGWTGTGLSAASKAVTIAKGSTGDRAYTATWTAEEYAITYMDGAGTMEGLTPAKYTIEAAATLPTPSKTGYTFAGWYDNAELTGEAVTAIAEGSTGAKIFYAKWTENAPDPVEVSSITVSAAESATSVTVGQTLALSAEVLPAEAENKTVKWSSNSDKATVNEDGVVTGVTATAEGEKVTITATAQDGSGVTGTIQLTVAAETPVFSDLALQVEDGYLMLTFKATDTDHGLKVNLADEKGDLFGAQNSEFNNLAVAGGADGTYKVNLSKIIGRNQCEAIVIKVGLHPGEAKEVSLACSITVTPGNMGDRVSATYDSTAKQLAISGLPTEGGYTYVGWCYEGSSAYRIGSYNGTGAVRLSVGAEYSNDPIEELLAANRNSLTVWVCKVEETNGVSVPTFTITRSMKENTPLTVTSEAGG